jgi:antitoxin (DNA-binding transcriptional repressor) of toxin-antitoxin stability system
MTIKMIDLEKTDTDLDSVLALIGSEVEVVLTRGDILLARVTPAHPSHSTVRIPNLGAGTILMSDDFNAPLPDDFWTGEA